MLNNASFEPTNVAPTGYALEEAFIEEYNFSVAPA